MTATGWETLTILVIGLVYSSWFGWQIIEITKGFARAVASYCC